MKRIITDEYTEKLAYIGLVERREIERENAEWINIRKVREQLKKTCMKAKQHYEELLNVLLEPGEKKICAQSITITKEMTLAFSRSFR